MPSGEAGAEGIRAAEGLKIDREFEEAIEGEEVERKEKMKSRWAQLKTNDSAVQVLGDQTLRKMARELVERAKYRRHD